MWALANNEPYSAATIHFMEEGLDEGDIIIQENVPIQKNDSAFALFYRCCKTAADQLMRVANDFENDDVSAVPQDLSQKTYFSWPNKDSIRHLRANGFRLATVNDLWLAIVKQETRL